MAKSEQGEREEEREGKGEEDRIGQDRKGEKKRVGEGKGGEERTEDLNDLPGF